MDDPKKQEIIQAAASVDLYALPIECEDVTNNTNESFSLSQIGELGLGFETLIHSLSSFLAQSQGGIYKVTLPAGGHLAAAKDGTGYLGSVLSNSDNKIMAQARLEDAAELACDPTMLFMAVTLANIQLKLNEIQDTQEDILDLLIQKEKAKLRGSLKFLTDAISNYKYNWDNQQYKDANYNKALDIRQEAEQSIIFARSKVDKALNKKELINTDHSVAKQITKLKSGMEDYQLAVYLLGLSYYAEILLQGNFEEGYLQSIAKKIDEYSIEYREMYSDVYNKLEKDKSTALQGILMKGIGKVGKDAGGVLGKVPLLNKGPVDEMLKKAGKQISKQRNKAEKDDLAGLLPQRTCNVKPFIDTIDVIDRLYNKSVELAFDSDKIYVLKQPLEEMA